MAGMSGLGMMLLVSALWHVAGDSHGCQVHVKPFVIDTVPSYMSHVDEPTVTPTINTFRGLIDISVQTTGEQAVKAPWTLTLGLPEGVVAESAANASLADIRRGSASLHATDAALTLEPAQQSTAIVSFYINAPSMYFAPTSASLNGEECKLVSVGTGTDPGSIPDEKSRTQAAEVPVSFLDDQFIGVDGKPFNIKGINWFGFENGQSFFDGMWGGNSESLTREFSVVVQRIINMGFNAVRVPISFPGLWNLAPKDQKYQCTFNTVDQIKASLVPPGVAVPTAPLWPLPNPATLTPGICNGWLPTTSTYTRFLAAMRFLASNGLYIMLDNHLQGDTTIVSNVSAWVANWKRIATDFAADPLLVKWTMYDLLNEPDAQNIRWTTGLSIGGMQQAYIQAMDAIYQANPKALMLIEGTGQLGLANNWGDGTWTDAAAIAGKGVQDAAPFFRTILTKPYRKQVGIANHFYPPSISTQTVNISGAGLNYRLDKGIGYLAKTGYCYNGDCQKFPVVIGETGTTFNDARDVTFMGDFAKWFAGPSGSPNVFYWCWNANSGDTGGIVGDNWSTINWQKVQFIQNAVGLKPWYLIPSDNPASPSPPPANSPPPSPRPPPPRPPPRSPPPRPPPPKSPPPARSPPPRPPSPKPPPSRPPPRSPPPRPPPPKNSPPPQAGGCNVRAVAPSPWQQDATRYGSALQLYLSSSTSISVPYTLTISSPVYVRIDNFWNWAPAYNGGGAISGAVSASWQALGPGLVEVNVGGSVIGTSTSLRPTSAKINGITCTIT